MLSSKWIPQRLSSGAVDAEATKERRGKKAQESERHKQWKQSRGGEWKARRPEREGASHTGTTLYHTPRSSTLTPALRCSDGGVKVGWVGATFLD